MRIEVRVTLISTFALVAWQLADGIKCLVTGTFFGQRVVATALKAHPTALRLPDGSYIDYGPWAALLVERGVDPHALAPFFVGLGALGLVALVLFLQARPVGWALLFAFAVMAALRMNAMSVVAGALALVLLLPSTRRLVFTRTVKADAVVKAAPAPSSEGGA